MFDRARNAVRKLTCRHVWMKTGTFQQIDPDRNVRYPLRRYECVKCHKVSTQDGRCDMLEDRAVP